MALYFGRDDRGSDSSQIWAGMVGPFCVRIHRHGEHVVWVIAARDTCQEVEFGVAVSPRAAARDAEDALRKRHLAGRSIALAARFPLGDAPCVSSALPV